MYCVCTHDLQCSHALSQALYWAHSKCCVENCDQWQSLNSKWYNSHQKTHTYQTTELVHHTCPFSYFTRSLLSLHLSAPLHCTAFASFSHSSFLPNPSPPFNLPLIPLYLFLRLSLSLLSIPFPSFPLSSSIPLLSHSNALLPPPSLYSSLSPTSIPPPLARTHKEYPHLPLSSTLPPFLSYIHSSLLLFVVPYII